MQNSDKSHRVNAKGEINTVSTQLLKEKDVFLHNILQWLESINDDSVFQENMVQYSIIHQNIIRLKQQDPNWKLTCYYEENCIRLKHYSCHC